MNGSTSLPKPCRRTREHWYQRSIWTARANTAREWAFSVIGGRNFMAVWCRIFEESAGPAGQLFLVCPQQLAKLQRNRENNSGVLFPRNDIQRTDRKSTRLNSRH